MKKLLTAIALVLALCLPVFAFAACSQEDEIKGEQLQGEEQWRQAFADTVAARKKCGSLKVKETAGDIYTSESICYFDLEKHIISYEAYGTQYGGSYVNSYGKVINYVELKGNSIYVYSKTEMSDNAAISPSNGWEIGKSNYVTEEAALAEFGEATDFYLMDAVGNGFNIDSMSQKYATEETGEGKDLSELFAAFTYDEEAKEYSAKLYCDRSNRTYPTEIKITFADGKIAKYYVDFTSGNGETEGHIIREVVYGYTADITIPEEAKNGTLFEQDMY